MSERKGWGTTVLGWFVVQEDGAPAGRTPSRRCPCRQPARSRRLFVSPPPAAPGGQVEFQKSSRPPASTPRSRTASPRRATCSRRLPAGTEPPIKKQIVEASLKAFGVPIDQIIETGAAGDPGARGLHPRRRARRRRRCSEDPSCASASSRKRSRASNGHGRAARRSSRPWRAPATTRSSASSRSSSSSARKRSRASSASRRSCTIRAGRRPANQRSDAHSHGEDNMVSFHVSAISGGASCRSGSRTSRRSIPRSRTRTRSTRWWRSTRSSRTRPRRSSAAARTSTSG